MRILSWLLFCAFFVDVYGKGSGKSRLVPSTTKPEKLINFYYWDHEGKLGKSLLNSINPLADHDANPMATIFLHFNNLRKHDAQKPAMFTNRMPQISPHHVKRKRHTNYKKRALDIRMRLMHANEQWKSAKYDQLDQALIAEQKIKNLLAYNKPMKKFHHYNDGLNYGSSHLYAPTPNRRHGRHSPKKKHELKSYHNNSLATTKHQHSFDSLFDYCGYMGN